MYCLRISAYVLEMSRQYGNDMQRARDYGTEMRERNGVGVYSYRFICREGTLCFLNSKPWTQEKFSGVLVEAFFLWMVASLCENSSS